MKPLNPRLCTALTKAATGESLSEGESKSLLALSLWIHDGCPERGATTGHGMLVPKGMGKGHVPEPWEYDTTLTGLAPLEEVEEKVADILLTESAPSSYHLGKARIIQHDADERF